MTKIFPVFVLGQSRKVAVVELLGCFCFFTNLELLAAMFVVFWGGDDVFGWCG